MTNFQDIKQRPRLLTPERLVLLWPIAGGALLLVLVALASYPPLLSEVQERRKLIAELQSQKEMLPLLRRQLAASLERQQSLTSQNSRLLTLVAGTGELKTWLASINDLAVASGLSITQVEPGKLELANASPTAAKSRTKRKSAKVQPAPSADPLLVPSLEKRSAEISIRGSYPALRTFLRRLETLQVVTIASELSLRAAPPTQQTAPGQPTGQQAPIELTLKLSAYGRAAGPPDQNAVREPKPSG